MIDMAKFERIRSGEAFTYRPVSNLADLDVAGLLALRAEIEERLPSTSLNEMNLEKELVLQYHKVVALQQSVLSNEGVAPNQQAQVCNAVASTLQQLVKMQSDFFNAERFKAIENLMITYMKKLPIEVAEAFVDEYERLEGQ